VETKWGKIKFVFSVALAIFTIFILIIFKPVHAETRIPLIYHIDAEQGDAVTQYKLAWAYSQGRGVPQDYSEAAKWYFKAAEQGITLAQLNLGEMYLEGKGVKQDYSEAAKWYLKAAEQEGLAGAKYNLGRIYYKGNGISKNKVIAYMWFELAAQSKAGMIPSDLEDRLGLYFLKYPSIDMSPSKLADLVSSYLENLSKEMTPSQIEEAKKLAREWKEKHELIFLGSDLPPSLLPFVNQLR
jgi:TPR repeat protein